MAYFTLAELRALPDMSDTIKYTDARVTAVQGDVESVIDRSVRSSFDEKSFTDTLDGGREALRLSRRFVRSITSVTEDGVALTAGQLLDVIVRGSVLRRRSSGSYSTLLTWEPGVQNIVVVYTAGYSATPPADIKEAALKATRYRLLTTDGRSGASDRALSIQNEFGNVQLSTAGPEHPFGLPEVDEVVMGWSKRLAVPGIA